MQRVVTQFVMFGVNILTKSFMQAYQQAKSGGGAASNAASKVASISRMPMDQARQLLNVEAEFKSGTLTRAMVIEAFDRHYAANDVDKGGSFYLQSKVWNAKETLLEELRRKAAAAKAGGGGGGAATSGAANASKNSQSFRAAERSAAVAWETTHAQMR